MKKIISALVLSIAPLLALQSAQAFPDRPVKLVVPTPAGGPPDIMARLLSDKMGAALGQPVIVENRPGGAGGTIGAKSVMAAEPDGYTLLMGSTSAVIIAPLVHKSAGYTSATFAPVAGLSETTEVLAVHPSVQANSVAELVSLAKSQPGTLRYGSAGIGGLPHLEGELLKARARDRNEPRPLSRRRSGADGPAGRRGSYVLLGADPDAPLYPRGPLAGAGRDQRNPQPAGAGNSDHGGERVRSVRHRVDHLHRRASGHADGRSGSRSAKRWPVRSQATKSNKPLPRWAPTRGRPRRSSLLLTWQSNRLAGLES